MPQAKTQQATITDFNLTIGASSGYRSREDQTLLPPGILVKGSKNVLTNTANRIASVKGYSLDGAASAVAAPILASTNWQTSKGAERHLRAGFLTSAGNDGKLQFRYDNGTTVTWIDLLTGLTNVNFNFVDFWDYTTEKIALLLFVNGSADIKDWSGGVTTFASATANTITKQGTTSWAEESFLVTGTTKVKINGTEYTYTGGETSTTLTGVTPDPTSAGHAVGSVVFQSVRTTLNSAMTGNPLPKNDLIGILNNQVYVADFDLNDVYVSKANSFTDYSFTANRKPNEGAIFNLGETPIAFIPQEEEMYIGTENYWYLTKFQMSADNAAQSLTVGPLKTASKQGPKSQAMTNKDKNNVVYVSNEPVLSAIGRVQNIYQTPQISDYSFPIVDDFNEYDFTDGSVAYWKNFIFVAVPKHSLIRIFNQTNPQNTYWEAPVTYPVSRFYVVEGELYGHSYQTSESYKLFDTYSFNGSEIDCIAKFSFDNVGTRSKTKGFNQFYSEGYISANTDLTLTIQKELDGCATTTEYDINGDNAQIVCLRTESNSLGKNPLGSNPLGGNLNAQPDLPPKFRVIHTMPIEPYFYEFQPIYSSLGFDQQWEILAYGPRMVQASDLSTNIKI